MSLHSSKSSSILVLYVFLTSFFQFGVTFENPDLQKRQASAASPLVDFQVYEPVLTPSGGRDQYGCIYIQKLMSYEFANSYGAPFVGMYLLSTPWRVFVKWSSR